MTAYSFCDTQEVRDGYDFKSIPDATPDNMLILMNKINELIDIINFLKQNSNEKL